MEKAVVKKATLGRLPKYLDFLKSLSEEEFPNISATVIAKNLSLGEVQVRKDLSAVSGAGKPKIGYITKDLIASLERVLGKGNITYAVLVGAGKLGKALLGYDEFEDYGVSIAAGFDCDKSVLEENGEKPVLNIDCFEDFCDTHSVQIGIITVSAASAQNVCDRMIKAGIAAIWNFAPCELKVPEGILVKQEKLALSLAYLNNQLCD